jgi:TetR/AcrR family transcriptional repressor of nem operon
MGTNAKRRMTQELPPKKEALLLNGKQLILTKGFAATTIDQICEAAGSTKGAFYYFFKNKDDFARQLLEYIWLPVTTTRDQLLAGDIEPLAHLHQHIDFMVGFLPGDGRLMGILMQELGETNPQVGDQIRGYFRSWTQYLQQIVEVVKDRHAPAADFTPQSLMEFILMAIEGVPVVARQFGDEAVERAVAHLKSYIDNLLNTKP